MIIRAVAIAALGLLLTMAPSSTVLSASDQVTVGYRQTVGGTDGESGRTVPTINDFLPEDRGLGECISAIPKPGCGSESRGGWRQTLVLLAILAGLGVIGWRIWAGARRPRQQQQRRRQPAGEHDDT